MNWLRKLRNSAYFLDFLLILAAIVAIIGLATFVRFHKGKNPNLPSTTESISSAFQKAEALSPIGENGNTDESSPADTAGSSQVEDASTSQAYECGSNCNLSGQKLVPNDDFSPAPICDETKKAQLKNEYDTNVKKENERYRAEIRSKQGTLFGGVTQTVDSVTKALQPFHIRILNGLSATLQSNLKAINCTL